MAKPKILYKNVVRTALGEVSNLNFYNVYIRDTILPADVNREFKSQGGFKIDYPTNDSQPNEIFYGSNCTVPFIVEDANGQAFIDLLIADQESRFLLEITRDTGTSEKPFWRGVFVMDEVEHENRDFPYLINLVAIDGISQLKERDAPNISGETTTISQGKKPKTLLDSFIECISQTSVIDLFEDTDELVVTSMRWFEKDMVGTTVDPIANMRYPTYKIEWDYDDFNNVVPEKSFTILERLFTPLYCRIIQLNGSFHIIQLNSFRNPNITIFRYAKNYQRDTQNPNTGAIGVLESNASIPVRQILDNNQSIDEGIYNQEEGALFRYYGAAERVTAEYIIDQSEQVITKNLNFGSGLNDTNVDVFSDPNLTIDFDFEIFVNYFSQRLKITAGSGLGFSFNLRVKIQLVVFDGVTLYYYDEISGAWGTGQSFAADFVASGVMTYTNVSVGQIADGNTNTLIGKLINAQTPPINGSLFCRIDVDYILGSGIDGFMQQRDAYNNVLTVSYNGDIGELVTYKTLNTLAPKSSIVIDLGTQQMGDQVGETFWGCWLIWNGTDFNTYSSAWSVEKASGAVDIISLLNKEVLSIRRKPVSAFDVVLLGDYNPLYSILYDSETYAFMGGTFNSKIGAWSVTMLQMTYNNSNISTELEDGRGGGGGNPTGATLQVINNGLDNRLRWRGTYEEVSSVSANGIPTLFPNDVTLQDGWLTVAVNETTDPPAPQQVGDPFLLIGDQWTPALDSDSSVIYAGHEYTFTEGNFLKQILVFPAFVGANYTNNVHIANITDPNNIIYETLQNLTLTAQEWNVIKTGNYILTANTKLLIWLETINSSSTTDFSDGWTFGGNENTAAPPLNGWNKRTQNNIVRFEYQSLGGDYTTQIQNLIAGSTITISENGAPENNLTFLTQLLPVDFGTYAEIGVSLVAGNGNIAALATCDVTFSSPVPQPTSFILDTNYWNNFPPPSGVEVTPVLEFDGVDQLPGANFAFGVDIQLQDGTVSEDYNYLAYTESLSGGTNSGASVEQLTVAEKIAGNPFSYFIADNSAAVKIKGDLFTLRPIGTMFIYDSNYNLVENTVVNEDDFFIRDGDNIILKDV